MENKKLSSQYLTSKVDYNPFEDGDFAKAAPTTESQREMWASIAMDKNATLCYNETLQIKLQGPLELDSFKKALRDLVIYHDALRTVFSSDGKNFFVREFDKLNFELINFMEASSKTIEDFKCKQVETPFDLVNGPLYRMQLLKISHNQFIFLMSAHHLICDGWSFAVLFNKLSLMYNAYLNNHPLDLRPESQFIDYATKQFREGIAELDRDYWLGKFKSPLITNDFPTEFPRPAFRTFNSKRYDFTIPKETVIGIKKLGAKNGCSFYTTLMTALNLFLFKLTKSQDIVVGMASAAQSADGTNDLVGHLVNLVPLRVTIDDNYALKDFFKIVRSEMFDAFDHQSFAYGSLVQELTNIKRDPSQLPLLNIVFNIDQQTPNQGLFLKNMESQLDNIPRVYDNFELFINAASREDQLTLECQYNTNLFSQSLIENWLSNYLELLNLIVKNPEMKLEDCQLEFLRIPKNETIKLSAKEKSWEYRDFKNEETLKKFWIHVLGTRDIDVFDNFFELGGHSLLAIELASLIERSLQKAITIKDIFENPTIVELSHFLISEDRLGKNILPDIEKTHLLEFDVSSNQFQNWYVEQLDETTTVHNLPSALNFNFKVDVKALEKAFLLVVNSQDSMRTVIEAKEGKPIQRVLPLLEKSPLVVENISESDLMGRLNLLSVSKFQMDTFPLFKAILFKVSENRFVFFFMVHHSIWDGWSFDIFFEKLGEYYKKISNHLEIEEKKEADHVSYIDYTHWINELIANHKLDHELNFWKKKLASPLSVLELPLDFKRPLNFNNVGDSYHFVLQKETQEKLRHFSKLNNSSIFNILLTVYKICLSRYTGLDDIIVGMPVRGRLKQELKETIGFFVNTIALRSHIKLNKSFESNLAAVTKNCIEAFENQNYPFQLILNSLHKVIDPSRTPIFQTFFTYQDVSNRSATLGDEKYNQINLSSHATHTDLDIWFKTSDEKIEGAIEYRRDLFKKESIEFFFETFEFMIHSFIDASTKPLNLIKSLPDSLESIILKKWNNSWSDTHSLLPFHHLIQEVCLQNPKKLAIETSTESLTYGELNKLSNQCAHLLMQEGVTKGDLVGLSISRDINMVAMILGILKAGAGYVPLDPGFPQDRLDYMIESARPRVLLTEEKLEGRFKQNIKKLLVSQVLLASNNTDIDLSHINDLEDTAYVIYTSGSTGNPKGVQLTHGSVTNFLLSMKDNIKFGMQDKLLAVTTLSFDIAVLELYLPLISGGSIYLSTSQEAMDGLSLKSLLENKNITLMQATPSTWRLLLANGWKGNKNLKTLCGGEAFPIDLAEKLVPICREVWNMYGPTETTVWSTCKKLNLEDEFLTVGQPIANTTVYILDDNRMMLPIGAAGELFIGGYGLARGYFGREDLTSERFIPDPFFPGERMYATGDLARFKSNGELECLGRNDGQVKIRGYRIELGEIEAELQKVNNVKECTVITGDYRPGDTRIFAYYSGEGKIEDREFRQQMSKKLPGYMVPSHFIYMQEIPKTLNGKIDKKSLPKLVAQESEIDEVQINQPAKPASEAFVLKEEIRKLWADLIGINQIDDRDNFFNIGGNSLIAVNLFSKIGQKYGLSLPLSALISSNTFNEFVQMVESKVNPVKYAETALNFNNLPMVFKSVVCLSNKGDENPVFCFHGAGGNVLNYISLVGATNSKRPFMGMQSIGLDGITKPLTSIESMARYYISEIKLVQQEGPYLLAGGSMGGLLAFEVAHQLEAMGDKVEKIIMFDTFGPNFDLKNYGNENDDSSKSKLANSFDSLAYRIKFFFNKLQMKFMSSLNLNIPLVVLLREIERCNYQAIWKYRPNAKLNTNLELIRARIQPNSWYADPHLGWDGLIRGKINIYEIDGNHHDFIESPELVKVLKKLIN